MTLCAVVLNYNGIEHLKDCLPSLVEARSRWGRPCAIVVLDNCSTEKDADYVKNHFPNVELLISKRNDILFSLNDVMASRAEDLVILLNNDMRFDPHFLEPLVAHFSKPNVFAVTAKVLDWEGRRITTGRRLGFFNHFWFYKEWDPSAEKFCFTLDAGGGCAAFRREMFLKLGGFDRLYHPAYWEDTDLSYRAWQRGWSVIYEPRSVIYHKVGATLDALHGDSKLSRLICRNGVLFTIKNCGSNFFLSVYLVLLPLRFIRNLFSGNHALAGGVWDAARRIPRAVYQRIRARRDIKVPDAAFLQKILEGVPVV